MLCLHFCSVVYRGRSMISIPIYRDMFFKKIQKSICLACIGSVGIFRKLCNLLQLFSLSFFVFICSKKASSLSKFKMVACNIYVIINNLQGTGHAGYPPSYKCLHFNTFLSKYAQDSSTVDMKHNLRWKSTLYLFQV